MSGLIDTYLYWQHIESYENGKLKIPNFEALHLCLSIVYLWRGIEQLVKKPSYSNYKQILSTNMNMVINIWEIFAS